jgi:transcriptional regulator with XRE-family HTH domain
METSKPFSVALRDLLIENDYATASSKPSWAAFAAELDVHYETLRRAMTGDRRPSPRLMEECARALRIRPEYFLEYRVYLAQRDFDPQAVGLERVIQNLNAWASVRERGAAGSPAE